MAFDKTRLQKIDEYTWEIPESYRKAMKVPARVYASRKMLDLIARDKSLEQLVNIATLPGVAKFALAMPDVHQGYGSPVGGVIGIDLESGEGIISPGMIGFDINCIHGDTDILTEHGYTMKIKDLVNKGLRKDIALASNFRQKSGKIILHQKQRVKNFLYQITTQTGKKIKVTGEHPLLTPKGMKRASQITSEDFLAITHFEGVPYEKPIKELLLDESVLSELFYKVRGKNQGNSLQQITKFLKERDLLPLYTDSPKIPYLLKILGFIFGNGTVSLHSQGRGASVGFCGEPEDLKKIQEDLQKLGLKAVYYERERQHTFRNSYNKTYHFSRKEASVQLRSFSFALLVIALGAPVGNKTTTSYTIPGWIKRAPAWQKRLFLASFFGAELQKPKTMKGHGYSFYALQLNISKQPKLRQNALEFLKDIKELLGEFNIQTSKATEVPGCEYQGKTGKTIGLRLCITGEPGNLIRFFTLVGYEYNQLKQIEANLAAHYLKLKQRIVKKRAEVRKKAVVYYQKSGNVPQTIEKFTSKYTPEQFILHSTWGRGTAKPRIAFNYETFAEFKKQLSAQEKKGNFIWDKIQKIEKLSFKGDVYDLTVNHPAHNFIANGIVVSNCGVRVLVSNVRADEVKDQLKKLAAQIQRDVPSGLGRGRGERHSFQELERILEQGPSYFVKQGIGTNDDLGACEENGRLEQANPSKVSQRAKQRGADQVGTLGSGNHFLELQQVVQIFEKETAKVFGLMKGQLVAMIHSGSRGLGHQVASDYIKLAINWIRTQGIKLVDKELAYMPFQSQLGQDYWQAMGAAANFAWANRHMIAQHLRQSFQKILGDTVKLETLYDVAHNIAKIEQHEGRKLLVHRKGATRAFWAGHPQVPERYRAVGQPVLIPGSMGTSSWILVGSKESEKKSFGSACHGAGRVMSRTQAKKQIRGEVLKKELESQGVVVEAGSMVGLAEEAPAAYKDVDAVVEVVHRVGLARKVAQLQPLAVIKG